MGHIYRAVWGGKELNLSELNDREKELLRECFELFKQRCDYRKFFNKTNSNESLKIMGGEFWEGEYWIDKEFRGRSVIYKVLEDLADILGIEQGFLLAGQEVDFTQNEEVLECFLTS